ncbi:MAG: hypothetical protein MJ104_00645 [Lachnospiraceae bacterium]|nr:hypothetical protein [Lachnospiraceae bacterium]
MYIVYGVAILLLVLYIRGLVTSRKENEKHRDRIKRQFGKSLSKDYSEQGKAHRVAIIKNYSDAEKLLDDITWNDLEMERIFERIDSCRSAAGEEDLYFRLHDVGNIDDKYKKLINEFDTNEEARFELTMAMCKLGYLKKLSPYDYLDFLTKQEKKNSARDIIMDILFIPLIVLSFFYPLYGAAAVFILLVANIFIYFRDKRALDGLLVSLSFIVRVSEQGIWLSDKKYEFLAEENARLDGLKSLLRGVRNSGSYLIASGRNNTGATASSSPIEIVLNYINMALHIDLIQYRTMLGKLSGHKDDYEWLIRLFGTLDSAISVASFRRSLENGWAEPEIGGNNAHNLSVEAGYHPLIKKPVVNSISTERGVLLTGSNASGKSTFLRMIAINAIMAQTIHTVCAKKYKAPKYKIYSSIALTDNLLGGESYFIVEIKSLKRILDASMDGEPVLCFVDEVLRGTNTVERISASKVILESLNGRNVLSFAATHDGELCELLDKDYDNYHFEEKIVESDISFDYELKKGPASTRNALKLLRSYGYDMDLIDKAENMAYKLDSKMN